MQGGVGGGSTISPCAPCTAYPANVSNGASSAHSVPAHQQPVLLLFLGSGAPSFLGRGMVEKPAGYWFGGTTEGVLYRLKETPDAARSCPSSTETKKSSKHPLSRCRTPPLPRSGWRCSHKVYLANHPSAALAATIS